MWTLFVEQKCTVERWSLAKEEETWGSYIKEYLRSLTWEGLLSGFLNQQIHRQVVLKYILRLRLVTSATNALQTGGCGADVHITGCVKEQKRVTWSLAVNRETHNSVYFDVYCFWSYFQPFRLSRTIAAAVKTAGWMCRQWGCEQCTSPAREGCLNCGIKPK